MFFSFVSWERMMDRRMLIVIYHCQLFKKETVWKFLFKCLRTAYVACDMLQVDMDTELIIVEEILFAEITAGVQEDHVAELVDVAPL